LFFNKQINRLWDYFLVHTTTVLETKKLLSNLLTFNTNESCLVAKNALKLCQIYLDKNLL
jgi:hypothetical protein